VAHVALEGRGSLVTSYMLETAPEQRDDVAIVSAPSSAWISLALVAVIGVTALPVPFIGDQALFSLGGQALAHGRFLYTGFWDTKQPGVFWFFRAGGALFGYSQIGAHAFELIWQLALAALVVRVVRGKFEARWVEGTTALLTVGVYYMIAGPSEMTQVEALVGLPVLAAIWLFHEAGAARSNRRTRLLIAAAASLFVVALFKLMLIVIPLAAWWAIARARPASRPTRPAFLRAMLVGFVLPAAVYAVWVAAHGALGILVHTWFVFPAGMPSRAGRPLAHLFASVELFLKVFAPILVLAAIGVRRALPSRHDALAQSMVAWTVAGTAVFIVQMWWFYLLLVLVVPLGILAAYGIDTLWSARAHVGPAARTGVLVVLVASSSWMLHRYAQRMDKLATNGLAVGSHNLQNFRYAELPHYATIARSARYLDGVPKDKAVFVWGDPLYLYLTGRQQPLAVNGWAGEALDRTMWARAGEELAAGKPAIVFLDRGSVPYIEKRGERVAEVLSDDYVAIAHSRDGTWYELKTDR
jgi:hypothetical protein